MHHHEPASSWSSECVKKPLEIYVFIDPLCPDCWALEPNLKKLQIEYGRFFSIRHILSGKLASLNLRSRQKPENLASVWERTGSRSGMSCDGDIWFENPISSPSTASIAIKAAEFQGRRVGLKYLRELQEQLFLHKKDISDESNLIDFATKVGLDVEEFQTDMHSENAQRAFQCDLKLTSDMEVEEIPTLVFFNENIDEAGMKVTGCYPYDVYVNIIQDLLQDTPDPSSPPSLEKFLSYFKFVASKEISVVYNMPINEVEKEMKKLLFKRKVELVPVKYGTFWKYID
ncbi:ClpXP adapter SpxH family protein [Bacillus salitolerans]|uniref:ClpXP adapter protein SpxH n=1 Tax=Bacillus salitolerans TaxID=1437434 RepID=A0ABW4LJW5_9BACI